MSSSSAQLNSLPSADYTVNSDTGIGVMAVNDGALAPGSNSSNIGMYLGMGDIDDVKEPSDEICS